MGKRLESLLKVSDKVLYSLDFILWAISGFNIVVVGIKCFTLSDIIVEVTLFFSSLTFFNLLIFPKVVKGNIQYIKDNSNKKQFFWKCMKSKSWLIMAIMMSLGFSIRYFELLPNYVISGFYLGLGLSLILSSIQYFKSIVRIKETH